MKNIKKCVKHDKNDGFCVKVGLFFALKKRMRAVTKVRAVAKVRSYKSARSCKSAVLQKCAELQMCAVAKMRGVTNVRCCNCAHFYFSSAHIATVILSFCHQFSRLFVHELL